jgi:hypothetical protein
MANPYPANITRPDGTVSQEGFVDFTDPDNQPGGGGGPGALTVKSQVGAANYVQADAATNVTCNGSGAELDWLVAAPPAWADDAGHITEAGLYEITIEWNADVAATTPGQYLAFAPLSSTGASVPVSTVPIDFLQDVAGVGDSGVIAVNAADLPYQVTVQVYPPTDATAIVTGQVSVGQLATAAA